MMNTNDKVLKIEICVYQTNKKYVENKCHNKVLTTPYKPCNVRE